MLAISGGDLQWLDPELQSSDTVDDDDDDCGTGVSVVGNMDNCALSFESQDVKLTVSATLTAANNDSTFSQCTVR